MRAIIGFVFVLLLVACSDPVYAETVSDPRYCGGEPKRTTSGKILRSKSVRLEFERIYPLPVGYKRDEWQVDHTLPLANGGCDSIINMQWLPKAIKTCAGDWCKDRWERILYQRKP